MSFLILLAASGPKSSSFSPSLPRHGLLPWVMLMPSLCQGGGRSPPAEDSPRGQGQPSPPAAAGFGDLARSEPCVSTHTKAQRSHPARLLSLQRVTSERKGLLLSGKGSQAPPPPSRFISAIVIKALTKWFSCLSLLFNLLISYFSEVHYHPEAGNWELGLCGFSRLHLCFR